ncbi:MAG: hypothetical protein ACRDGQ_09705 [Candidatus Limnocylindrales bacterium]
MSSSPLGGLLKIVIAIALAFAWSQGLLTSLLNATSNAFSTPRVGTGSITIFGQTLRTGSIPTPPPPGATPTSAPAPAPTTAGGTA